MADAMKAVRQGVEQEATDELIGANGEKLRLAVVAIILPTEGDGRVGHADQARVRNGDTVCVAAEIGQHLSRSAEGRLGVHDPLDPTQFAEPAGESGRPHKIGEIAEEAEFAGLRDRSRLRDASDRRRWFGASRLPP